MRRLIVLVALALVAGAVHAPSAGAARAIVLKGEVAECRTDPGDVPGTGAFPLPNAILVLRSNGGALLNCHGTLPEGVSFSTFVGTVPCGVPGVTGRIVVTTSGRVNAFCVFPPGTFL
jgi:hypothetical protein